MFQYGKIRAVSGWNVEIRETVSETALLDEENPDEVIYSLVMEKVPESDDGLFYLFALECYEDEEALPGEPAASWKK